MLARGTAYKCFSTKEEIEAFRAEAFEFACDEGYDHPAFTDWVWPDAAAATAADRSGFS